MANMDKNSDDDYVFIDKHKTENVQIIAEDPNDKITIVESTESKIETEHIQMEKNNHPYVTEPENHEDNQSSDEHMENDPQIKLPDDVSIIPIEKSPNEIEIKPLNEIDNESKNVSNTEYKNPIDDDKSKDAVIMIKSTETDEQPTRSEHNEQKSKDDKLDNSLEIISNEEINTEPKYKEKYQFTCKEALKNVCCWITSLCIIMDDLK